MAKHKTKLPNFDFIKVFYKEAAKRNGSNPLEVWLDLTITYKCLSPNLDIKNVEVDPSLHVILNKLGIANNHIKITLTILQKEGYIVCNPLYFDTLQFKFTEKALSVIGDEK